MCVQAGNGVQAGSVCRLVMGVQAGSVCAGW